MFIFLFIGMALMSYIIQLNLKNKFKKYSKIPIDGGLTGRDVAEKMLRENGIYDVKVIATGGQLTDFYNPANKTVNLSDGVYASSNIMAAAVAAHECGHALQHAQSYAPLKLRSSLVPIVSFASNWVQWILLAGVILVNSFPQLLLIGIVLFASTTIFSLVTLPVEIDASNRACNWLVKAGITNFSNHNYVMSALRSAAYTYVIAAVSSLATLIYYVMIYLGGRRD